MTLCSISPTLAASEGMAAPAVAVMLSLCWQQAQQESPLLQPALLEGDAPRKDGFLGVGGSPQKSWQKAASFLSCQPFPRLWTGVSCPGQEAKATSTTWEGVFSSIFYIVPLHNSSTCIFTIKRLSPGIT